VTFLSQGVMEGPLGTGRTYTVQPEVALGWFLGFLSSRGLSLWAVVPIMKGRDIFLFYDNEY
jgi:hypothetical protein